MHDDNSPHPSNHNHYYDPPTRWHRLIAEIKRRLEERRIKYKHENAQDKAARRTANATVWIAIFAFVTIGLGAAQFFVLRDQLRAMQGQLDEMKEGSRQTERAIALQADANATAGFQEAVTSRIADNARDQANYTKRLADISDKELNAAKISADAARVAASSLSKQLEVQRTSLYESYRPWLYAVFRGVDDVVVTDTTISAGIILRFVNEGTLPAEDIESVFRLMPIKDALTQQEELCHEAAAFQDLHLRNSAKQGINGVYDTGPQREAAPLDRNFSGSGPVQEFYYPSSSNIDSQQLLALPAIVGCIVYFGGNDKRLHHTRVLYWITELDSKGKGDLIEKAPHTVPSERVIAKPWPDYGNSQD